MNTETVPIGDLHHDPANVRLHSARNLDAIRASLTRFGQQKPIVVDADNIVRAGNGTLEAARSLGWETISIVRSELLAAEMTAFAIADNRTAELAEWDYEALGKMMDAIDGDGDGGEDLGFSSMEIEAMNQHQGIEGVDTYSRKIEAPTYEPKGDKPELSDLVDSEYTEKLVAEIRAAGLPEDIGAFLEQAAQRHTVFRFDRIADFYAHSDDAVQGLMEQSALVIIDFDQAIENGFVKVTEQMLALVPGSGEGGSDA